MICTFRIYTLAFLVIKYFWEQYINLRQLRTNLIKNMPPELTHYRISLNQFLLSQSYSFDKMYFLPHLELFKCWRYPSEWLLMFSLLLAISCLLSGKMFMKFSPSSPCKANSKGQLAILSSRLSNPKLFKYPFQLIKHLSQKRNTISLTKLCNFLYTTYLWKLGSC